MHTGRRAIRHAHASTRGAVTSSYARTNRLCPLWGAILFVRWMGTAFLPLMARTAARRTIGLLLLNACCKLNPRGPNGAPRCGATSTRTTVIGRAIRQLTSQTSPSATTRATPIAELMISSRPHCPTRRVGTSTPFRYRELASPLNSTPSHGATPTGSCASASRETRRRDTPSVHMAVPRSTASGQSTMTYVPCGCHLASS